MVTTGREPTPVRRNSDGTSSQHRSQVRNPPSRVATPVTAVKRSPDRPSSKQGSQVRNPPSGGATPVTAVKRSPKGASSHQGSQVRNPPFGGATPVTSFKRSPEEASSQKGSQVRNSSSRLAYPPTSVKRGPKVASSQQGPRVRNPAFLKALLEEDPCSKRYFSRHYNVSMRTRTENCVGAFDALEMVDHRGLRLLCRKAREPACRLHPDEVKPRCTVIVRSGFCSSLWPCKHDVVKLQDCVTENAARQVRNLH
ncbi:unnamed protein product [Bemisia tabaci]|uniref:Uncharacterized protein n=1 Tax=Bemisia tabaci TaxID=7038 RepID=A0A9P0AF28_BEMTA|nr:unnamed protein product [Bemisia tabaci]